MREHPTHPWLYEDASAPVRRHARRLMVRGEAVKEGHTVRALAEPYCDSPVVVRRSSPLGSGGLEVEMLVPCRKCEKCLQFRASMWAERARNEIAFAELRGRRTWLVTLTFSPPHLAGVLMEARRRDPALGVAAVDRAAYAHVSGYLHRVRKASGPFRYLAVFERGERTGRAHYHLLLHEGAKTFIRKAVLESRWRSHVHARLVRVDEGGQRKAAAYVAKYATKDAETRIRASRSPTYGTAPG